MIYDDGYIVQYSDGSTAMFSDLNPLVVGPVSSETSYTVKDEDTLFSIAEFFYRDTEFWYVINEWNNLGDPIALVTGTELKLPNFG